MTNKTFYITTAIDYVNAEPHIGHAFEKVVADVIARWNKLQGKDVFFMTGVDENAQKNVQAAQAAGVSVKKFINKNVQLFEKLCKLLNISYDKFVRTTTKEHTLVVHKILKKMLAKKDIYKDSYEGLYCTGCESYITEKGLINGKCPEHNKKPEHMKQEAYFFKLSKYKKDLIKFAKKHIVPESKKKEILSRLEGDLRDVCITRKDAEWGVDFPGEKGFKVWVWIDALINYISGAEKHWPANLHVIGKGINWFHSVIWPAMLMSAGYALPDTLLVHGYVNVGGKKMSKSLGNVISPIALVEKYDSDSIRYSLLRGSTFEDFDYSEELLISRHNNELANKLGNLISRVSGLIEKNGLEKCENKLIKKLKLKNIEKLMDNYGLDKVLNEIFAFIDVCNEYVQNKKPWETKDKKVLYEVADSIKAIAILLWPFIPETSEKIAKQFGFKIDLKEISKPLKIIKMVKSPILFKKIGFKQEQTKEKISSKLKDKTNKPKKLEGIMTMTEVNFDDWRKLDLRVAEIKSVEEIEGADKLYKIELDVGKEIGKRIICAGLKEYYSKEDLKGKRIIYFANLTSRKMRGIESQGMLLAASTADNEKVILITPESDIELGSRVG